MLHSSISSTIVECGSGVWNQDQPLIFGSSFVIYSSHHCHCCHHLNSLSQNSSTSGAPPLSWGMWACRHRWRNHKGDPTNGRLMQCINKTHDENRGLFCSLSCFSLQITFNQTTMIIPQTTTSMANGSQVVEPKIHCWFWFILLSTTAITINNPNSIASPSPL